MMRCTTVRWASRLVALRWRALLLLTGALCASACSAQADIEYRARGNRAEGVRNLPVSGYSLELLSFRALPLEAAQGSLPAQYHIRFFLDRDRPAHLVVREVENRYSYWLDKVRPTKPWRAGFDNIFDWSTREVLAQLPELPVDRLAVTVRLDTETPSSVERVAPAIVYHTAAPKAVTAYEVVFVANARLRVDASVERIDGSAAPGQMERGTLASWPAGVPFTLRWDAMSAPAGSYRLRLRAQVRENLERFDQLVEFHHQPVVR